MNWGLFDVKDEHSFERYKKLIISAQNGDFDYYDVFEKHHIFPNSLFPELKMDKENLVKVPLRLHFILHYLLYKFTKTKEMTFAFNQMRRISKNSRLYANARIEISRIISESNRGKLRTEKQKQYMRDITTGTCCYRSSDGEIRRFVIGMQPEGWIFNSFGRIPSENHRIKVGNANRGRKIFRNITTNEIAFQRDSPGAEWTVGHNDIHREKISENMKDMLWYYNEISGEQIRSKTQPAGLGWIRKRLSSGNFKGFSEINNKVKVLNLITKKIEIVDEKMPFHINHPGKSLSNIIFLKKDNELFCNKKVLDFPKINKYNSLAEYRIPKPHHNMTEKNIRICEENEGKSLSDLGYEIISLQDFQFSNSLILRE